jgi:hypothetical protein
MVLLQAEPGPTAAALAVASARPATELNTLFEKSDGWIGGDGATSVRLGPGRTLWLFADTWVGRVEKGKRFSLFWPPAAWTAGVAVVSPKSARLDCRPQTQT